MLRDTIQRANGLRNGNGNGKTNGRRTPARTRTGPEFRPRRTHAPPTHGELLRTEIPSLPVLSHLAPEIHRIADRLTKVPKPAGTALLASCPKQDRLRLDWENTTTQHCITVLVQLTNLDATYEYSMVCEEHQELRPFPDSPLGSELSDRVDLNLRNENDWRWLAARIRATGQHGTP